MNRSRIVVAAAVGLMFAAPVFGGAPGSTDNGSAAHSDRVVAELQAAADKDLRDGRNGNKNNLAFSHKAAQVDNLIDRIKSGEQVDPKDIDDAMAPVHVP
jgi:hypothetical protein